jgi:hypothetical protein
MIYRVVTYDRTDERMRGSLVIPSGSVPWAKKIARVAAGDDGLGEYPLDAEQTNALARHLGFKPDPEHFYYYLEPYEPPENTGFQPADSADGAQA